MYSNSSFPISINLDYQVDKLSLLGEISGLEKTLFAKETKKIIETVGQIIRETTQYNL